MPPVCRAPQDAIFPGPSVGGVGEADLVGQQFGAADGGFGPSVAAVAAYPHAAPVQGHPDGRRRYDFDVVEVATAGEGAAVGWQEVVDDRRPVAGVVGGAEDLFELL